MSDFAVEFERRRRVVPLADPIRAWARSHHLNMHACEMQACTERALKWPEGEKPTDLKEPKPDV